MISLTMSREDWRTGSIPELPLLRKQKFKTQKGVNKMTYIPKYSRERQKKRRNNDVIRVTTSPFLTEVHSIADATVNIVRNEIKKANYQIGK